MTVTSSGLFRVDALGTHRYKQFMLVAETPRSNFLASHVGYCRNRRIGPRDLQRPAALEYLGDIHQVGAFRARGQHFGHPSQAKLGLAGGDHLLRHDVDRAFKDCQV